jgi:hypothetical protein
VLGFKTIDLEKHREEVVNFRKDSFVVSFGNTSGFDEDNYLRWLEEKISNFPEGFVLVEKIGMEQLGLEVDGKVIRMKGEL